MARSGRGYGGYRGRRTMNDLLKIIAAVLAVLVALLLAGLYFGRDYLAQQGGIDLPFFHQKEPISDPGDVSVVIQPGPTQSGEEPQGPKPQEEPAMVALELPVEAVLDGTAAGKLEEAGANALVLEMKNQEGLLSWVSEQTPVTQVNGTDSQVNQALAQWNQGGVYTVARVCCFRDNTVPYHKNTMALRSGQGNWRDELGLRWMDPSVPEVRSYLAALCGELARLGFDEILLENCTFPVRGNLNSISWRGETDQASSMEDFLAQVEQALEPYGAKLSIRTEHSALDGGKDGGLTPALLERYAHRLWMAEDGESPALADLLTAAGVTGGEERLVVLTAEAAPETKAAQAVLQNS